MNDLIPITSKAGYAGKPIYDVLSERIKLLELMLIGRGFSAPIERTGKRLDILSRLRLVNR
jgi:hypothetical protein